MAVILTMPVPSLPGEQCVGVRMKLLDGQEYEHEVGSFERHVKSERRHVHHKGFDLAEPAQRYLGHATLPTLVPAAVWQSDGRVR